MANLAQTLRQVGYVTPQGQVTGPNAPLAQQLKNYVTNVIPTAAQNIAQQRADIDAAITMGQNGIQVGDREAFERQMAQVPNLMGLTAYHGTNTKFNKFKDALANTKDEGWLGKGHYFSTDPNVARANKYVANVELEVNKPYELVMPNFSTDKRELIRTALNLEKNATAKDVTNKLQELGHDSVVLDYSPTGYKNKEILVFGGKQANIKNWADVPKTSFNKTLLENEIKALQSTAD